LKSLIVSSTRKGAGKTSISIGLARALGKKLGYVKPLGDRFLYRKKRLWDYDAALLANVLELNEEPETISIGFDHSKLRYMYDRTSIFGELDRILQTVGKDRDAALIECGRDLSYGASVCLDPLTISQETGQPVLIVAGGEEDSIADDLAFVKRFVGVDEATVAGVIINKVVHVDEFESVHLPEIEKLGIKVFGVIPHQEVLTTRSVGTVADKLFARVLAGEDGMQRTIKTVVVGAMSANAALSDSLITQPEKLVITSGDRSDMILAALDAGGTAAIVLTNNIVPPANVVSKAAQMGVPLLLVPGDTFAVAMQVDRIESLITPGDQEKIELVTSLVRDHVDLEAVAALI